MKKICPSASDRARFRILCGFTHCRARRRSSSCHSLSLHRSPGLWSGPLIDRPTGNKPAGFLAHRGAWVCPHRGQQNRFDRGIRMNPSSGQSDGMGSHMRIRIVCNKSNRPRQNSCLVGATRALLAPVARQRVQGRTTNPSVGVIEHRHQVVHDLGHEEVIQKLTAPITYIGAVMAKRLPYRRKGGETAPQQSAMRATGVVRNRQLLHKISELIA